MTAKGGNGDRDRHLAVYVGTFAVEYVMVGDRDENIKITSRGAVDPGLALAGKSDASTFLDAGGDRCRQSFFLAGAARAGVEASASAPTDKRNARMKKPRSIDPNGAFSRFSMNAA